jgi:predicted PurR-regulated permease PerM
MVAGVHAVESYLLYPQIYSAKLKLHPIVVLASLIGAEHFAGIPGLFLAMPITLFTTNHLLFPKDIKRDSAKGKIIDSAAA